MRAAFRSLAGCVRVSLGGLGVQRVDRRVSDLAVVSESFRQGDVSIGLDDRLRIRLGLGRAARNRCRQRRPWRRSQPTRCGITTQCLHHIASPRNRSSGAPMRCRGSSKIIFWMIRGAERRLARNRNGHTSAYCAARGKGHRNALQSKVQARHQRILPKRLPLMKPGRAPESTKSFEKPIETIV